MMLAERRLQHPRVLRHFNTFPHGQLQQRHLVAFSSPPRPKWHQNNQIVFQYVSICFNMFQYVSICFNMFQWIFCSRITKHLCGRHHQHQDSHRNNCHDPLAYTSWHADKGTSWAATCCDHGVKMTESVMLIVTTPILAPRHLRLSHKGDGPGRAALDLGPWKRNSSDSSMLSITFPYVSHRQNPRLLWITLMCNCQDGPSHRRFQDLRCICILCVSDVSVCRRGLCRM
jgi:hypothetical protein